MVRLVNLDNPAKLHIARHSGRFQANLPKNAENSGRVAAWPVCRHFRRETLAMWGADTYTASHPGRRARTCRAADGIERWVQGETAMTRLRWAAVLLPGFLGLLLVLPPAPADEKKKDEDKGWVPLFNGTDLKGWKTHPDDGA